MGKTGESPVTEIDETNKRCEREAEPLIMTQFLVSSFLHSASSRKPLLQYLQQRKHQSFNLLHTTDQQKTFIEKLTLRVY